MQVRHRIPTIFNLSMVDVLCCALGCVILLWLINMREFKQRAVAAAETGKLLVSTRSQLDEASRDAEATRRRLAAAQREASDTAALLRSVRSERDEVMERAETLEKDRDLVRRDLDAARARLADLMKEAQALKTQNAAAVDSLTKLKAQIAADEERVARLSRAQVDLTKEKTEAGQRLAALEKLLREKESLASAAGKQADELALKLRDAEDRIKSLRSVADLAPGLKADIDKAKDRLAVAELRARTLEEDINSRKKDLAEAQRAIATLEGDKKTLADRALRAQAAAENRFAGMALTGRRVVFLVDMSGSMELIDEKTPAPEKWVGVRETIAKIMRSLQNLEKYQVILFSDRVDYLLHSENSWLDFDLKTSPEQLLTAMSQVRPRGNTNIHAGMQSAFRFRQAGMDTIYFLSDGLPNIGEGLSADAARGLSETQRSEVLSRHIRNVLRSDWNRELTGRPRVRINTLGFFYESPDVGAFLWALARENDGSFVGMSKP